MIEGLVWCRVMAIPFIQFSSKKQVSDWLAPGEAIVNNNNSLVAPLRDFDFGELLGTMELSLSNTLNLQSCSASAEKIENGSL